jgi:membrane protein
LIGSIAALVRTPTGSSSLPFPIVSVTLGNSSQPVGTGAMVARKAGRLTAAVLRASVRHRLTGHAAEIAFFGLLALVPATVTVGGVLRLLAHIGGRDLQTRGVQGAEDSIRLLMGAKLADSVVGPFVSAQLSASSSGLALGGLIITAWLFSRLFYSFAHALDVAYGVEDRPPSRIRRLMSLANAIGAVVLLSLTLAVMVLGLHGGRAGLDRFMGHAPVISTLWKLGRWPLLFAILLVILMALYRYSPSVRYRFRHCLPGAVLAVILWTGAAVVFRVYLLLGAAAPTGVSSSDRNVTLIGRAVGAAIGTAVFMYFSTVAILVGAELNAQLAKLRRIHPEQRAPSSRVPKWPRILPARTRNIANAFPKWASPGDRTAAGAISTENRPKDPTA